ncbi:ABC transporter substrate-binding protein [Paracoccus sp. 1_MG-2023]|uniref:ABC transporter substrate-binding protein n=1 Tax=unclassified Paracoccus (in: a-proteobacteria) TaxID=2688777 RepID=UPI001C080BE9|nr:MULTISPECIES: ABC transporter substrate-binding protein [unclassified Paracoccus (in: a-proteobacteria)]MBU2957793.1 ABC transporter substrate-binding protein [Paracoccus sp. C2R09]MDO6667359.1 ABC transporter substrate-binding protein [Paracoccus sp. 1_MG-2023]
MFQVKHGLVLAALLGTTAPAFAQTRTLVMNTDASDPAPKAAFEQLIADFEAEYPDIKVEVNVFDHEGYKTAIRNFLTADAPDLANWYAGNRMRPFVEANQFMDVSDVWAENGLEESLHSAASSMTIDGKQWGVPYTYYQWGIYYNRDAYAQAGVDPESIETWDDFIAACEKIDAAGIDCLTTGSKALWPIAGIFDYVNLRTNGYDFHMQLTSGEVPWTDDRVKAAFANWEKVLPYTTDNHAAIDWQDAVANLVQGKAANYVMGNFAVAAFKDGGMTDENLGFMPFPTIDDSIARAEDAPTDTIHIPAGAKNPEDAKLFLAFLARADVQTKMNETLGQLPINADSTVVDDPYLQQGFEMLSSAEGGIAQFFDRDASPEMAKAGMEGFQEFMVRPERLDQILDRLERQRQRLAGK